MLLTSNISEDFGELSQSPRQMDSSLIAHERSSVVVDGLGHRSSLGARRQFKSVVDRPENEEGQERRLRRQRSNVNRNLEALRGAGLASQKSPNDRLPATHRPRHREQRTARSIDFKSYVTMQEERKSLRLSSALQNPGDPSSPADKEEPEERPEAIEQPEPEADAGKV